MSIDVKVFAINTSNLDDTNRKYKYLDDFTLTTDMGGYAEISTLLALHGEYFVEDASDPLRVWDAHVVAKTKLESFISNANPQLRFVFQAILDKLSEDEKEEYSWFVLNIY